MNAAHLAKIKKKNLARLHEQLKIVRAGLAKFPSDDAPLKLVMAETQIQQRLFKVQNG